MVIVLVPVTVPAHVVVHVFPIVVQAVEIHVKEHALIPVITDVKALATAANEIMVGKIA